ncbi:unnamed protein product [Symbiodinium natans]|uniref:Uncharacterized protein n=1 Tax=Symbiodinium natans TaxID=878477 RepID=A0A812SG44_9DINO|nr:unnamed protein product [Symbiodinium natans]
MAALSPLARAENRRLTNHVDAHGRDGSAEQLWGSTCQRLLLQLEQLKSIAALPLAGVTEPRADICQIQSIISEMQSGLLQSRDACGASGPMGPMRPSGSGPSLALGSHVLQSLDIAKKRCENLNRELVRQARSHEELVTATAAIKDANKRLLEQTQLQRDEIETIAQQGVADEQRLQISRAKHANDYSSCQTESSRHLAAARSMASHRQAAVKLRAADKLRHWRIYGQICVQEADTLRAEAVTLRSDAQALHAEVQALLATARDRMISHGGCAEASARRAKANVAVQALADTLKREKESRTFENATASHRQGRMSSEIGDLQGRLGRDLSQLVSQSQALERTMVADKQAWTEEMEMLKRRHEEDSNVHARGKEDLAALLDRQAQLQLQLLEVEQEMLAKQKEEVQLRGAAQQTDAALTAATTCGRHLQQQIEEQSEALQHRNEAELTSCQEGLDRLASKEVALLEGQGEGARRRAQAWEHKVREDEEALQELEAQNLEAARECEALAGHVSDLRGQHAAAQEHRRSLEDRLADDRREAALEHVNLQAATDQLTARIVALEAEMQRSEECNLHRRRAATDAEVRGAARASSTDGELTVAKAELTDLKKRWQQAVELRSKTQEEVGKLKQQMARMEAALLGEIQGCQGSFCEELSGLKLVFKQEKEKGELAQAELQQLKMQAMERLRSVQEEQSRKLALTHQAKVKAEGARRSDLKNTSEAVAAQQRHIQALEKELQSLRHLLDENDCSLSRIREELVFEEGNPNARVKEEVMMMQDSVLKAADEDARLSQQLEATPDVIGVEQGMRFRQPYVQMRDTAAAARSPGRSCSFRDLHSRIDCHLENIQRHNEELHHGRRDPSYVFQEPTTLRAEATR